MNNIRWRMRCSVSDASPVFVLGAPRSGTTLMQRMLSVHPELFSTDSESGLFSYRDIFARKYFSLSWDETHRMFRQSSDVVNFMDNCTDFIRRAHGLPQTTRMVEKTPQHVIRLNFLVRHFPNARFVHMVRDCRDCYCSAVNHPNIQQARSLSTFTRYWVRCVRSGLAFDDHPHVCRVSYEQLTTSPRTVLAEIMESLKLPVHDVQFDPSAISNDRRSQRNEFSRLAEPISPTSVQRWKRELSERELECVQRIAGELLSRLGYTDDSNDAGELSRAKVGNAA